MIRTNAVGKYVLTYEATGVIRRLPVESRGTSRRGTEWMHGNVWLEVFEEGVDGSVPLCLSTWDEEMWETLNRIGIGKKIRVKYHVECSEYYDGARISFLIDEVGGMSDGEDYIYGTRKGGKS